MEMMMEAKPPTDGDIVQQRGNPNGPAMRVDGAALGEQHVWEGVRNGVYCTWMEDGEDRFEVFNAKDLVVVGHQQRPT
ncbi:hypothetical protein [Duganella sp. Dugasp56]|uniref:hypothetical protein n=1 Tax=Duganella sp. Dugasp56 TaxID=3243046 RepID=UPI0039B0BF83